MPVCVAGCGVAFGKVTDWEAHFKALDIMDVCELLERIEWKEFCARRNDGNL